MKLYFAGNFPMMKDPEKEKSTRDKILSLYPKYRRLVSFFFKKDAENLIRIKDESQS